MSDLKEKIEDILFSIDEENLRLADAEDGTFIEEIGDEKIDFSNFKEYDKKPEPEGSNPPICSFTVYGGKNMSGEWEDYLDQLSDFCVEIEDKLDKKALVYKIETDIPDDVWSAYFFLYNKDNSLNEAVEIHDELNPKIWNDDQEIKPEVKSKIIQIVDEFRKLLALDKVELKIEDIYILGSNANYNYNEDSDLDVHIIADESFDCSNEHLPIIYNAYKALFNNKYDLYIKGINVEIYVENKEKLSNVSSGVYSFKDGWIKKPARYDIPEIDNLELSKKVQDWEDKYYAIVENPSIKKIEDYIDAIYDLRVNSIKEDGEFGLGNLTFKEIRKLGYLQELKDLKAELVSKDLSLESLEEGYRQDLYDKVVKYVNLDLKNGYKSWKYPEKMNDLTLDAILGDMSDERLERALASRNLKGKSPNWCGKMVENDRPWTWLLSEVVSKLTLNETAEKHWFEYNGPIYAQGKKLLDKWIDRTFAVSKDQAINNLRFKANKYLNEYGIELVDEFLKELKPQKSKPQLNSQNSTRGTLPTARCKKCGRLLTTSGECPLCDLGDESVLDEAIKKGKKLQFEDDLCIMYHNGEEVGRDIFDYLFDDADFFYDNFKWDDKSKTYVYKKDADNTFVMRVVE